MPEELEFKDTNTTKKTHAITFTVRFDDALIALLNSYMGRHKLNRSKAIRKLIMDGMKADTDVAV